MKTPTLVMLVVFLAMCVFWATAVPLQPVDEDRRDELQAFLEQNPAIATDLYPGLLDRASDVTLTVDQNDVMDLLESYVQKATIEEIEEELEMEVEEEEEEEEEGEKDALPRKKRQIVTGNIDTYNDAREKSVAASFGLSHAWDKGRHSFNGFLEGDEHTVKGEGTSKSYNAGVDYNFHPSKKTSIGLTAHKTLTPHGRSRDFGLSFSHKFAR